MREAPETSHGTAEHPVHGPVRFDAVSFRYAPDRPWALHQVSLEIAPGTLLAVVGAPGSGKSTFVKLLLGLDRPDAGRIALGGVDVQQIGSGDLRRQIGVVPQEVQLFAGSIADNIVIGLIGASRDRIVAAARFVGLDDVVQHLPDGYDTLLGERGTGLSAGQRQLVALARAIVRNPHLLVLDEATSALDLATETRLLQNLRRAGSGRTIIMVTHRLSLLAACDRAILLRDGRVVRDGPAAEIARALQLPPGRPGLHAAARG